MLARKTKAPVWTSLAWGFTSIVAIWTELNRQLQRRKCSFVMWQLRSYPRIGGLTALVLAAGKLVTLALRRF